MLILVWSVLLVFIAVTQEPVRCSMPQRENKSGDKVRIRRGEGSGEGEGFPG